MTKIYKNTSGSHFEEKVQRERKAPRAEGIDKPNRHDDQPFVLLRRASTVEPENIRWLWWHFLARRKVHLVAGPPGVGKSTVVLNWAAILSRGSETKCWEARAILAAIGADLDPTDDTKAAVDPSTANGPIETPA